MDNDLSDAVEDLKAVFKKRKLHAEFGKAPAELVEGLKKQLPFPSRYRSFLLEANPTKVETVTPVERIRLLPAEELIASQPKEAQAGQNGQPQGWKPAWVMIGESSLLSDPYFLDTSKPDPEGDCPVYTAMIGQDKWQPKLAASSFAQFLRIVSTAMEIAAGFGDAIMDDEDEDSFREALGPKVKVIDTAALRAGHWT
ncbi:MAG: SMI1/KNR4 family protein [Polyangiaceae bacterium]